MNKPVTRNVQGAANLRLLLGILFLGLLPAMVWATGNLPAWWAGVQNSNPPSDYSAANQGQLKNVASAAVANLDANLPGGAGAGLHALINQWATPTANTNDYAAINLGQVKNVAQPFYYRLIEVGFAQNYPWSTSSSPPNDYAMANIGQLKNLFSFEPLDLLNTDSTHDTDGNGMPDWWQLHWFGHLGVDPNALAARGDGLTNLQAYQQGRNPNDYFNGQTPIFAIVDGNNQTGSPNSLVAKALVVSFTDAGRSPVINRPVTFTITAGGGQFQASSSATPASTLTINTDSSGQAKVYFLLPNTANTQSQITCSAVVGTYSSQVLFTEHSDDGTGTFTDPFDASNVVATVNSDGSVDISWTNNTDPSDTTDIPVQYKDRTGTWTTITTVPAGTTSYHIGAQQ